MGGARLHEAVAVLTDIAFARRDTSIDQVRSALAPTTRSGRSSKRRKPKTRPRRSARSPRSRRV
jgi:hypothetical protein